MEKSFIASGPGLNFKLPFYFVFATASALASLRI